MPVENLPTRVACAEWAFKLRRMRDQVLGGALFGEPAWDALLVLAAARDRGEDTALGQLATQLQLSDDATWRVVEDLRHADLVDPDAEQAGDLEGSVALTEEGYTKLAMVLG
ncbi:hypothetical protein [Pelagerythrobacter sp.]|uniref:hypothetical protein n=1 Tax=Pelagerythrobacter sp. TaxID=2800702 RepID=UPI0035B3AB97